MRADLGIRRDPIMEILDEPNLPTPRLSGDMEFPLALGGMAAAIRLFAQRYILVSSNDDDSVAFERYVYHSGKRSWSATLNITADAYRAILSFDGTEPTPTPEPDRKTLDRERMKAHVAEQRRRQRARR